MLLLTSIKNVIKKLNKNSVNVIWLIFSKDALVEKQSSYILDTKLIPLITEAKQSFSKGIRLNLLKNLLLLE